MPFDGTVNNVEANAKTVALINALIAHYGLPQPEPLRSVRAALAKDMSHLRRTLGIKGDRARACILKAAAPDGWPAAWSLTDVNLSARTFGELEDILMRAFDCASRATMRPFKHRRPARCVCTPPRSHFFSAGTGHI